MSVFYSGYGMGLCADRQVPGLAPLSTTPRVNVRLYLGSAPPDLSHMLKAAREPWYVSPLVDERGEPASAVWRLAGGDYLRVRYRDGTEFVLDRHGTHVWATWLETSTLEDAASYLLGPVLGLLLRLRGVTCLHASAVAVGGWAVAFLGPAGAGKSTTAAAFAGRGYSVLADDIAALSQQGGAFLVLPGYPRLRLWPWTVDALTAAGGKFPRLPPDWGERRYHLDLTRNGYRFQQQPLPLAAIYVLEERRNDAVAPAIEAMPAAAGLMTLVANTSMNYLLDNAMRAREFEFLGRVLACVPLRRITLPADLARLPALCDAVHRDVQGLTSAVAPATKDSR
jgi:hypothetical protein